MTNDPHKEGAVLFGGAPLGEAILAVVTLHGRGGSAQEMLGLGREFALQGVAYAAPQAAGHTWYPLSFMAPRASNEPYLSSALAKVGSVVASLEQAGLRKEQIVIAGFSQGACLTTEFVVSNPARYGGLIAFTGGLIGAPGEVALPANRLPAGLDGVPALLASGDPDPHVPWTRVVESADTLRAMGAQVTAKRYPGRPHTITREELALARDMLQKARDIHAAK